MQPPPIQAFAIALFPFVTQYFENIDDLSFQVFDISVTHYNTNSVMHIHDNLDSYPLIPWSHHNKQPLNYLLNFPMLNVAARTPFDFSRMVHMLIPYITGISLLVTGFNIGKMEKMRKMEQKKNEKNEIQKNANKKWKQKKFKWKSIHFCV